MNRNQTKNMNQTPEFFGDSSLTRDQKRETAEVAVASGSVARRDTADEEEKKKTVWSILDQPRQFIGAAGEKIGAIKEGTLSAMAEVLTLNNKKYFLILK